MINCNMHRTIAIVSVTIALWLAIFMSAAAIANYLLKRSAVSVDRGAPHFASYDDLERIGCDLGGCQLVDGAFVCPQLDGDRYASSR